MQPFVIKVMYGGLGDHLFFSHLPRVAKSLGCSRVLISNLSEYRNPEYRKLVWESNPFVDGFTDQDAPYPPISGVGEGMNLLDKLMILRGLDDGRRHHEPEIFYKPNVLPEIAGKCLYDPNYISNVGSVSRRRVTRWLKKEASPVIQLKPGTPSFPLVKATEELATSSIYDYCDMIHSCKAFYCLASGGATLAAALGRPATVYYGFGQHFMFHHSRLHRYVNASPLKLVFKFNLRALLSRIKQRILRQAREVAEPVS